MSSHKKAENPGICALECYFPKLYVCQSELEEYDKTSRGKYTIGLGQQEMAFCSDHEDVYSLALTVVSNLLKNTGISEQAIGRLSIASETIMDHSKSIKSVVMQLFEKKGNTDIEGVDYLHACYAGTASLFDSINWMQSKSWDGRYAIIVCVDIAEYAQGVARPTGGAAAVAALIGPNAPIQIGSVRASYMCHAYDFYKPYLDCPYPQVDGHLSNQCFLQSLDECYELFCSKYKVENNESFRSDLMDYWMFHSPFNKLVRKSFARVVFNDFYRHSEDSKKYPCLFKPFSYGTSKTHIKTTDNEDSSSSKKESQPLLNSQALLQSASSCLSAVGGVGGYEAIDIHQYKDIKPLTTYEQESRNTEIMNAFVKYSNLEYEKKVSPSTFGPRKIGNSYTASLLMGLCSLLSEVDPKRLIGRKIGAFSYGSGICSTLFTLEIGQDDKSREALQIIHQKLNLRERLIKRRKINAREFTEILQRREEIFHIHEHVSYKPIHNLDYVFEDAYVLTEIDVHGRRYYEQCVEQKKKLSQLQKADLFIQQQQQQQEQEQKQKKQQQTQQTQQQQTQQQQTQQQQTQQLQLNTTKEKPELKTTKEDEIVSTVSLNSSTSEGHISPKPKFINEEIIVPVKHPTSTSYLLSFVFGGVMTLTTYLVAEKYLKNHTLPANKK